MSTKIYNGYKINISINDLIPFCMKTRAEMENIKKQLYIQTVTHRLTLRKDRKFFRNEDTAVYKEAMKEIKEDAEEMAKGMRSDWGLDFQSEAVFYLDGDDVFATFHTECTQLENYWKSLPIVLDYHYQNQTDKPNGISKQHWDKRKETWNKLLKSPVFAANGLSYSFTDIKNNYFLSWLPDLYTPLSRTERAKDIALDLTFQENKKAEFLNDKGELDYSSYSKFMSWLKTDEGKAAHGAKLKEIIEKLPDDYTLKQLCE